MNKKLFLGIIAVMLLSIGTVFAAKPSTFSINWNQAQFQWRAFGGPFGDWSSIYQNVLITDNDPYTLQGNSLHTTITFSPIVTNVQGASTNYVYDKSSGLWIQHEGTITYDIPNYYCSGSDAVCTGPYVTYWRGYLNFGGNIPSDANFVHGVQYQWIYYYSSQDDATVQANLPNAVWDSKVGAWLIGFSVYLWDKTPQNYNIAFPMSNLETVTVPAIQDTPTLSNTVLQNGENYVLKAYGTADAGDGITFDALCSFRTGSSAEWTDSVSTYESYGTTLLDLQVNGVTPWGSTCSPTHTYSTTIIGTGSPAALSLLINDIYYPNNVGNLNVDIYGSFIEPVPANKYNPLGL